MSHVVEALAPPPLDQAGGRRELVVRFGAFLLVAEERIKRPYAQVAARLADALEPDARVNNVASADVEEDWCRQRIIYPASGERDDLLTGRDALWGLRFDDSLAFSVDV